MNALEIEGGLEGKLGGKVRFLGCHYLEDISYLLDTAKYEIKPCVFVLFTLANNDKSSQLGHWISVYISYADSTLGYFDSYNLYPKIYSRALHAFIQARPCITVHKTSYRLQGVHSLVCGVYTMYFTFLVSHHGLKKAFSHIHNIFKKHNYKYNDKTVVRIAYKIFKMPICENTFCLRGNMRQCSLDYCKTRGRIDSRQRE